MGINKIVYRLKQYFTVGNKRSIDAKKNIIATFLIRGFGIIISLLLIPLTIHYVNPETYGIWLTLSSMVAWFSILDIGINNGLRNKLAECIAKNETELARKYVSTTYALLCIIFIPLLLIFFVVNKYLDWPAILNTNSSMAPELALVAIIVFGYFCFKFIFSTINIVLLSHQMPANASLRGLVEQIVSLVLIFILTKITHGSLLYLSLALCIAPMFVVILFNITLFSGRFKNIAPSFSKIDFSLSKGLFGLGIKFFVISIAGIIQFQTANFIIIHYFGAQDVTIYNIAYRYFSVLILISGILTTPLWSAITDAYAKGDEQWIINMVNKYQKVAILIAASGFVMLLLSNFAYTLWIGKGIVEIPFSLSFWTFVFTIINIYGGIYSSVLNGISVLKLQFLASLFSPIIFVVCAYMFINVFNMGIISIIIASIISNFNGYILGPLQYKKVFFSKDKNSFWTK